LFAPPASPSPPTPIAERLGCSPDARLLIIHADDLAVAHSTNTATFDALDRKVVSSASVMVPCPWVTEVAQYARSNPQADLGLHLTLTSEWTTYRWGSVASSDKVPSLLDSTGAFWATGEQVAEHARLDEVELEFRAQVERALSLGIRPTHLDSHMSLVFTVPKLFPAYAKVAHEYRLPFLATRNFTQRENLLPLLSPADVLFDSVVTVNSDIDPAAWTSFYVNFARSLKPGLTFLIVHLGYCNAELNAIMADHPIFGALWRQRDLDAMNSAEFQQALRDNNVVLIRWQDLQNLRLAA
jgi:predicted glycoside hydrolase/deacetylase ChbG (UPF0249 family)